MNLIHKILNDSNVSLFFRKLCYPKLSRERILTYIYKNTSNYYTSRPERHIYIPTKKLLKKYKFKSLQYFEEYMDEYLSSLILLWDNDDKISLTTKGETFVQKYLYEQYKYYLPIILSSALSLCALIISIYALMK